jgi:hypothetical protein
MGLASCQANMWVGHGANVSGQHVTPSGAARRIGGPAATAPNTCRHMLYGMPVDRAAGVPGCTLIAFLLHCCWLTPASARWIPCLTKGFLEALRNKESGFIAISSTRAISAVLLKPRDFRNCAPCR